jgi:hypothetical protein
MKLIIALAAAGLVSSLTAIAPTPAHAQKDPACVEKCRLPRSECCKEEVVDECSCQGQSLRVRRMGRATGQCVPSQWLSSA